jgi:hypothetical protein
MILFDFLVRQTFGKGNQKRKKPEPKNQLTQLYSKA